LQHGFAVSLNRHITHDGMASVSDRGGNRLDLVAAPTADRHLGAACSKQPGGTLANARPTARDEH
jgi:hypothetical protein